MLALWVVPSASATTTTLDFDSQSAGSAVTTVSGATFVGSPTVFVPVHVATQTPPNALHTAQSCGTAPSSCWRQEIDFDSPKTQVSLSLGLDDEAAGEFPIPYQLSAYNAVGGLVAQSDGSAQLPAPGYTPITHTVTAQSLTADISKVVLTVGANSDVSYNSAWARRVNIDHVTFSDNSVPPPPGPQVTISSPASGTTFLQPGDVRVSGHVTAAAGISRFCLTTSTASTPPATCAQSSSVGSDGNYSNLPVSGLVPGPNTITAWVQDGSLRTAHASVSVTVARVNLSATNLEVTQDIQNRLPNVAGPDAGALSATYNGVPLAAGRSTIARFWVGVDLGGVSGSLPAVQALLYGFRGGVSLGAPLTPIEGRRSLGVVNSVPRPGPGLIAWSDPASQGYTFRLPLSWTRGNVTLRAVVNPTPSVPSITECDSCSADNALTLSGIGFTPVRGETITPVEMITRDVHGAIVHPHADWSGPLTLLPFNVTVRPYQGQIDISDGQSVSSRETRQGLAMDKLAAWDDHNGNLVVGHLMAMSEGQDLGLTSTRLVCCATHLGIDTLAQVEATRPFTSVLHEFGHEIGLAHAGTHGPVPGNPSQDRACGGDSNGQSGTDWPPDQAGLLQGSGLDPRPGSGGTAGPFRVLGVVDGHDTPTRFFDFMSYCANPGPDDNSWISVRNWSGLLNAHATGRPAADRRLVAQAAARRIIGSARKVHHRGPALRVRAIIGGHGLTRIFGVEPTTGDTVKPAVQSPVSLVLQNAAGRTVSSTAVPVTLGHIDRVEPFMFVDAVIKAPSGKRLSLTYQHHVVARLTRPAHAPVVRLLTPRRGARIGGKGTTLVRWRVRNQSHRRLQQYLDYAANGRSFRTLVTGMRGTTYRLPNALLARSSRARLRIVVSDGWNLVSAVSGRLKVAGPAARGAIVEPLAGSRIAADGTFVAHADAWDEYGHAIPGRGFRWYDGRRFLGRGTSLTIHGFTPGRSRLVLITSAHGRQARMSTTLHVMSARPSFTLLKVKRTGSRHVVVFVASSVVGRLRIGRRTAAVGPRPRRLIVPATVSRGGHVDLKLTTFLGVLRVRAEPTRR